MNGLTVNGTDTYFTSRTTDLAATDEEQNSSLQETIAMLKQLANRPIVARVSQELLKRNPLVPMHATEQLFLHVVQQRPFWEKQYVGVAQLRNYLKTRGIEHN